MSTCWTSDDGAIGVVTFLEASGDPSRLDGGRLAGCLAGRLGAGGELEGGCRAHAAATNIMLAAGGCHLDVGFGRLQRAATSGVASQLSVWCGIASVGGACSTNIMGLLGLQRNAAGWSTLFDDSGVVYRRKTAQVTTWLASVAVAAIAWVAQCDVVVRRARFGCLTVILEHGAILFIILTVI